MDEIADIRKRVWVDGWELNLSRTEAGKINFDEWLARSKDNRIAFDDLMRNSVELLKGPNDPRTDFIIAYTQRQKAKVDQGRKPKRSEFVEEEILASTVVPSRRGFRRF